MILFQQIVSNYESCDIESQAETFLLDFLVDVDVFFDLNYSSRFIYAKG